MKKRIFTAFMAIVMAFSLTACAAPSLGGKTEKESDGTDSPVLPPKTQGSTEVTPQGTLDEETAQTLYNLYVDIHNCMTGRISDSLNRYFNYVDYTEEFKLLEEGGDYYDCYSIFSAPDDVADAYDILGGKGEKDALDQAFLNMYPSISALVQALNDISDYTSEKSYLEDNFAKSQELHTALMNTLDEYFTTGQAFQSELSIIASQRQMENLQQMKDEGYVVLYSVNMVILLAQQIEEELYVQDVWDDNILDMDLTTLQPLFDQFFTSVDAVLAYNDDQDALEAEGLAHSGYWTTFILGLKGSRDSLTKVLAKVEAGEPLDEFDTMLSMAGQCSLTSFAQGVSDMIDAYNRLVSY